MQSVLTMLLASFLAAGDGARTHSAEAEPPPPAFCADVQPFEAFTIADDGDEFFADEMGCTESDGSGPLDVEASLDAV